MRSVLIFVIFALCCIALTKAQAPARDCNALRRECEACRRRLNEGRDEDNIIGRLNNNCRPVVGRTWRNLNRCDLSVIRCRNLNRPLSCAQLAIEARRIGRP